MARASPRDIPHLSVELPRCGPRSVYNCRKRFANGIIVPDDRSLPNEDAQQFPARRFIPTCFHMLRETDSVAGPTLTETEMRTIMVPPFFLLLATVAKMNVRCLDSPAEPILLLRAPVS
jgi:hypothetical protein